MSLGQKLNEQQILSATAKALNLPVVRISEISMRSFTYDWFGSFQIKRTTLYHVVILWKNNNYVPPNLELCVSSIPMEFILEELTVSEHPAGLTIFPNCSAVAGNVIFKYPFFKVSLYPSVDVVTCPAQSVCSSHCGSFRFVLSPGQQPISAKVYMHSDTSSKLSTITTLSYLPDSIKLVSLAGLRNFSSTDLALLSVSCPNLVCLDIHSCCDALLNLQGLADVASNCSRLVSLNLDYIDEVESVALFWEILGGMKKLRHLRLRGCLCAPDTSDELSGIDDEDWSPFDNRSRSRILASVARLKLFALEINYDLTRVGDDVPLHFETLLPGLLWLQYLRITTGIQGKVNMTNILPYLPSLTHLAIVSPEDLPILVLPTDSDCYVGLKKLSVFCLEPTWCPKLKFVQAVAQSRTLTHLCLSTRELTPAIEQEVNNIPQLCECHVMVNGKRRGGVGQIASSVCGSVTYPKISKVYYLDKVQDLQSLFLDF